MQLNYTDISRLCEKTGSNSFYLLDEIKLASNFNKFRNAFSRHYANVKLGYSYKTNYIPRICMIADRLDCYAEVVSKLEYDIARLLKVKSGIIFNGPLKFEDEIKTALEDGNIVNIDSLYEIEYLKSISESTDTAFHVGIRCYFDLNNNINSRFGIDGESDVLAKAFNAINEIENISVNGLHCHFSVRNRDLNSFKLRTSKLIDASKKLFKNESPEYLDIGGGFFSYPTSAVKSRFPDMEIPTFEEYGEVVGQLMKQAYPEEEVRLIIEPGTAIVADCIDFYTQVISYKKLGDREVLLVDGSTQNIKPNGSFNNIEFERISSGAGTKEHQNLDIVGYTCMENDILYSGYKNPVKIGDFLKYENVGAYSIVFKPPFIKGQFPIVSFTQSEEFEICKRAETAADFLIGYTY